jgi:hypothetical protein
MAEDSVGFRPQKNLYINKCDLCTEVRTFLVQNDYQGSEELNPAEFYDKKLIQHPGGCSHRKTQLALQAD